MKYVLLIFFTTFGVCENVETGLNFLILGDWGGAPTWPYTTDIERYTAKQMAITAGETSASFVVALGDNFYTLGVKTEYDSRFETTYANLFNEPSLQIPWYVIGGNHDHYGNISAQVAYSRHSPYWEFPNLWHAHKMLVPGTSRTLKIVLIDTVVLCGNCGMDDELEQPKGAKNEELAESQWIWLEEQLKNAKDDYLIVGGHFPVWSIAEHGPTYCLVDRLRPLLQKYNVTSYVCGHDHNLQHFREDSSNVSYFVVGCANYINTSQLHMKSVPYNSTKFFWADASREGGFAHARVSQNEMTLSLIDSMGSILHQVVMKPRFG